MTATPRHNSAGTPASVAIIGAGYVGLTTAACLARLGHRICCGDVDQAKIDQFARGVPTIVEDGLDDLLRDGLASGSLRFVLTATNAVAEAEFVFLCVPNPQQS